MVSNGGDSGTGSDVEGEDNEDILLEKMLKEAEELALKMSQQQKQHQRSDSGKIVRGENDGGGVGKASEAKGEEKARMSAGSNSRGGGEQEVNSRAEVGDVFGGGGGGGGVNDDQVDISLERQQKQQRSAASPGPEKEAARGGGSDLEDLLRKSEELLQRMRSTTAPSPAKSVDRPLTSSSSGGGGGGGGGSDDGIHGDDATPTVGTPPANGIGGGGGAAAGGGPGGPPSPSLVQAPMYSPPAPRSVYVVHHNTNDSLLNESDEMSSIESSSLFLSPTERLGSWRSRSSSIPSQSLEGQGTGASSAMVAPRPSGNDGESDGGTGDSEMAVDIETNQSLLVPSISTDNNVLTQEGLASSRTKSPAVVTPAVSVPLVPNIRAPVSSQQGMMMSGIPNFNTESPKVKPVAGGRGSPSKTKSTTASAATETWEKVRSAQDGDDDYVPIVDYTTDATPKIRNFPTNQRQQQNKPSSLLIFNKNNNNLTDDHEDDDDEDDNDNDYDDDLTDSYDGGSGRGGGGGYSMRVAAYRRQQKKNRKKKLRRLIRSIAIGGVALVGLRYWYSTTQSDDIESSAGDPNRTVSPFPNDDGFTTPSKNESETQESRPKDKRRRKIDGDSNDDEKSGADGQLSSSFSLSSSSVTPSNDLTDVLMSNNADDATTGREFGDNLDNMAKIWTENPFIMKIFDDFEKQIIDKLQHGDHSESEGTQQNEKRSVEVDHDEEDKGDTQESNHRRNSLRGNSEVDELATGHELVLQETGNMSHQSFFRIPVQEIETMLWI